MSSVVRIVRLETGFVSYGTRYPKGTNYTYDNMTLQTVAVGVWLERRGEVYPAVLHWVQTMPRVGGWPEVLCSTYGGTALFENVTSLLSVADMAALLTALPRLPIIDHIRHDQMDEWLVKAAGGI